MNCDINISLPPFKLPEWQHNYRRMVDEGHISIKQMIKLMLLDKSGKIIDIKWSDETYKDNLGQKFFIVPQKLLSINIISPPFIFAFND